MDLTGHLATVYTLSVWLNRNSLTEMSQPDRSFPIIYISKFTLYTFFVNTGLFQSLFSLSVSYALHVKSSELISAVSSFGGYLAKQLVLSRENTCLCAGSWR